MFATHRRSLTVYAAVAAVAAVAVCAVLMPTGARAASGATVRVAEGYYPVTGDTPYVATSEPCPVRLSRRGTTALDALDTARRRDCVSSYVVEETANGPYLRCVNGRCESTGFYWAIYLNGALTCEGIAAVAIAPGDELTLSFEAYPTALALAACA